MIALLDVNVLVALAWPNHVHHVAALRWFRANHHHGWATCPSTQNGFVRVSSNQRILPGAKTPREAILLLEKITALAGHYFWQEDLSVLSPKWVAAEKLNAHYQVSDAHLLGVALRHDGCLATFDRAIRTLVPSAFEPDRAVCIIDSEML
jgi:toxin-antitoxin system PIN domain toxin